LTHLFLKELAKKENLFLKELAKKERIFSNIVVM